MPAIKEIYLDLKYRAIRWMIYIQYGIAALIVIGVLKYAIDVYEYQAGIALLSVSVGIMFAFLLVLNAQLLQLFIDIEWNQRETNELLGQIIANQPEKEKLI